MTDQHLDPPRMFESDAVPSELRQWLVLANQDVLSAPQIEQLASALERKAQAEGIGSSHPLSTPDGVNPWFKSSAGKLGLIAVAIGFSFEARRCDASGDNQ